MKSVKVANREVSQLGQGTWNMGNSAATRDAEIAALRRGIDLGMTVIDTAEMYGSGRSESLVGQAIVGRREEVYLVSKVLPSNASTEGTVHACEASLKRLGIETLDLFLLHWRGRYALVDTVAGFNKLVQQGKIRSWGVSNFDVGDMEELMAVPGGTACASNQILYNPEYRGVEFDLLPWCKQHGTMVMAYSPVGQGGDLLQSPVLRTLAQDYRVTPAQIALAWCLRQPVMAIPKAGSVKHVEENAAAAELQLTDADLLKMDQAYPAPKSKQRLATL